MLRAQLDTMKRNLKTLAKSGEGAMLLEFVICFPILFILFLFIIQFCHIMIAWQVVHYSAYMGARSAMTENLVQRKAKAEKVAKRILAVISASPADSKDEKDRAKDEYSKLDGWGWLPNTKYLDKQVDVDISYTNLDPRGVFCTVKFKLFLTVPVAGRLISFFAKENKSEEESKWQELLDKQQYALNPALIEYANELELESEKGKEKLSLPYITLTSTSAVAIPYSTLKYPISIE